MRKIQWASLFYTILVILWGAWVRISHSGDGCGASWPLCHGEFIPDVEHGKTWVEYTHRVMSGLYGILIFWLTWALHRRKEMAPQVQTWMKITLLFTISEALLGALLVKKGFVTDNDTPKRALVMALHFLNSVVLVGSLALTALFSEAPRWRKKAGSQIRGISQRMLRRTPSLAIGLFLLLGTTGTVAALSNTLYPTDSLLTALLADLDPNSHYLIRLRGLHPTLGLLIGIGLTLFFYLIAEGLESNQEISKRRSFILSLGFAFTAIVGSLNLLLHAPLVLKLVHLGMAHALWILLLSFWHSLRYEKA